jgi:hypothetical protein
MRSILLVLLVLFIVACRGGSYNANYFGYETAQAEYRSWGKNGATDTDVKKALLECGRDPYYATEVGLGYNEYVSMCECMHKSGFEFGFGQFSGTGYNYEKWKNYQCSKQSTPPFKLPTPPACLPGFTPPDRSVQLRLNSKYCQYYKKRGEYRPECQP